MKGRPPKPRHLKVVQGTLRKHRDRQEPAPSGDLGNPPEYFQEEEKSAWADIARECCADVLTNADRIAVEICSRLLAQFRSKLPLSGQELATLIALLGRFGMTPADRGRLNLPQKTKKNAFADF